MDADEFLKKVKRFARQNGLTVSLVADRGKGGHRLLIVGNHQTILKAGGKEIGTGLLNKMLKDLNIDRRGF